MAVEEEVLPERYVHTENVGLHQGVDGSRRGPHHNTKSDNEQARRASIAAMTQNTSGE